MIKIVFLTLITIAMLTVSSSCTWDQKKPSFLIIAIDSFPFESIHCNDSDKNKGFKIICEEMARFTHAYTPSILSQPALASLFTGKYPFEHGVWNNGSTFLSAKFMTSAEVAVQKGYHTLFVSGGVPAWRKSGLEQGFEIFEDNIAVDYRHYYREIGESARIFADWVESAPKEKPFFATLFVSDLQFPDFPTVDNEGFPREKTFEGQLREVDETLESLFEYLKKEKIWNNTWIIVTGVNGNTRDMRLDETLGTNLYHENTNVALFIKPPATQEHPLATRTIDSNVSLVDVGRLLFDLLDYEFYDLTKSYFKTVNLKSNLLHEKEDTADRILLFESGWPQWRRFGQTKFAFQKENYLLIYDKYPKLFNTLIDRNQIYPIDYKQSSFQVLTDNAAQLVSLMNTSERTTVPNEIIQKFRIARVFLKKDSWNDDALWEAVGFYKKYKHPDVAGWIAHYYITNERWADLLKMGQAEKNDDWIWLASQNLKLISPEPSICIKMIYQYNEVRDEQSFSERCPDAFLASVFSYLKYRGKVEKRETVFKLYRQYKTEVEIQRINFQNGYIWDTNSNNVANPQDIDILLATPKFSRFRRILEQAL